jgi:predicted 2-oxoglutarate/Fe(II)-dependent dioxygenase YbiX
MTAQQFKDNGYVHLKDFLHKDSCRKLTNELKRLVSEHKTIKDEQCPLSEAIHGAVTFDKLLEDLLPHFENTSGLKLFPTYAYARLYAPGEELKNHRDRPACEISATLTLDFEGDVWPIYMADEATEKDGVLKIGEYDSHEYIKNISEIKMSVGDAVMYRGCEKFHFREPYKEGKWQAQVFLHYVDQDGPHAEWKYDKRESLGLSKTVCEQTNQKQSFDDCYIVRDVISDAFCKKLIQEYSKPEVQKEPPYIGGGNDHIDLDIRNVQRYQLPLYAGIGATLASIGLNINHELWKYNITHSNQSEFLMYDVKGKYETHVDTFHSISDETRKLTVLAFLNDDFEGGKFYIANGHKKLYPEQTKGSVIIFPSFMPHGVEPIIKGIRYSVVSWMVGPYFK